MSLDGYDFSICLHCGKKLWKDYTMRGFELCECSVEECTFYCRNYKECYLTVSLQYNQRCCDFCIAKHEQRIKKLKTLCPGKCGNVLSNTTSLYCDICFELIKERRGTITQKQEIANLKQEIKTLREAVQELRDAILYAPGGALAKEAEARWN